MTLFRDPMLGRRGAIQAPAGSQPGNLPCFAALSPNSARLSGPFF